MTPKVSDSDRLTFLGQYRLNVQYDDQYCWIMLPDGTHVREKSIRKAVDEVMKWSRTNKKDAL
jgi:hypothetical protein